MPPPFGSERPAARASAPRRAAPRQMAVSKSGIDARAGSRAKATKSAQYVAALSNEPVQNAYGLGVTTRMPCSGSCWNQDWSINGR